MYFETSLKQQKIHPDRAEWQNDDKFHNSSYHFNWNYSFLFFLVSSRQMTKKNSYIVQSSRIYPVIKRYTHWQITNISIQNEKNRKRARAPHWHNKTKKTLKLHLCEKKICAKQILNEQKRFSRTTNMILRISIFN